MSKKVSLVFSDWDYTCGDGCCYEWGTYCKVNGGEKLVMHFTDSNGAAIAVEEVLTHLGYEVEIDFDSESNEEEE